jgi:hypothetical protein
MARGCASGRHEQSPTQICRVTKRKRDRAANLRLRSKYTRTMRVVDSTFYFFLRHVDKNDVLSNIENPLDRLELRGKVNQTFLGE